MKREPIIAYDFFNQKLEVGQEIAFMRPGYKDLMLGKVKSIADKTLSISCAQISHEVRQYHKNVIIKP